MHKMIGIENVLYITDDFFFTLQLFKNKAFLLFHLNVYYIEWTPRHDDSCKILILNIIFCKSCRKIYP